jgi:DNA-binding beta-propeller fold protein YncE
MRRIITLLAVAGTAVAVLSTLTVTAASAAAAATRAPQPAGAQPAVVSHGLAAPGASLWVSRYNSTGNGNDDAKSVAVSPNGGTVFITGFSGSPFRDIATVAYSAATGAQLWAARYNAPGGGDDYPLAMAVSPDGGTVFVTGSSEPPGTAGVYATLAYDAATGASCGRRPAKAPASAWRPATRWP